MPPDYEVVEQHGANHSKNHAEIELADPTHSNAACVGRQRRIHVHSAESEFLTYARMALPTCVHEVGAIDGGAWIGRRQDVVNSMATGTISDYLGPQSRSQTVIARQVRAGSMPFDSEFLGKSYTLMAASAGHAGEVGR